MQTTNTIQSGESTDGDSGENLVGAGSSFDVALQPRMMVTVKITNDYEDGHHSESEVILAPPSGDVDEWFNDTVYEHTGDGHGIDGMGSCYTATIIASDDPALLGLEYEWVD